MIEFKRPAKGIDFGFLEEGEAIVADLVEFVEAVSVEAAALFRWDSSVAESASDDESAVRRQSGNRTERKTHQDETEHN